MSFAASRSGGRPIINNQATVDLWNDPQDLSYDEIAEIQGMTKGQVAGIIFRMRNSDTMFVRSRSRPLTRKRDRSARTLADGNFSPARARAAGNVGTPAAKPRPVPFTLGGVSQASDRATRLLASTPTLKPVQLGVPTPWLEDIEDERPAQTAPAVPKYVRKLAENCQWPTEHLDQRPRWTYCEADIEEGCSIYCMKHTRIATARSPAREAA